MSTAFKSITDALVAACMQTPALADGRVWANRLRPLSASQANAVVVRLAQTQSSENVLGMLDWQTQFAVECYGRGTVGIDPTDAVDDLLRSVWSRLSGINAAELGAMSLALNSAIEWQFDEAETPVACAIVYLQVRHRTPVATLLA
jgi:hypothetical protein